MNEQIKLNKYKFLQCLKNYNSQTSTFPNKSLSNQYHILSFSLFVRSFLHIRICALSPQG